MLGVFRVKRVFLLTFKNLRMRELLGKKKSDYIFEQGNRSLPVFSYSVLYSFLDLAPTLILCCNMGCGYL